MTTQLIKYHEISIDTDIAPSQSADWKTGDKIIHEKYLKQKHWNEEYPLLKSVFAKLRWRF